MPSDRGVVEFTAGQIVIHPQHGTATVVEVEQRTVAGEPRDFVVLKRAADDLVLRIPLDSLEEIGVRTTMDRSRCEAVLQALGSVPASLSTSWHQRRSGVEQRIRSGDPVEVAEVVRDLHAYRERHEMPPTDRRMYEEARQRTVTELALALGEDEDEVEAKVDRALQRRN